MINHVVLTGHLGRDPEVFQTRSGTELTKLNLAVSQYNGPNKDETTMWVRCNLWGAMGKWANDLVTGDRVTVSGQLKVDEWESDDGETRKDVQVDVRDIHVPKRDSTSGERTQSRSQTRSKSGGSRVKGASRKKSTRKKKAPF